MDIHLVDGTYELFRLGSGTLRGSRFDEAGVPVSYVSKILGHASLSTTTRYLNIQRRGLHLAMTKLEESQKAVEERRKKAEEEKRKAVAQSLHTADDSAPAVVRTSNHTPSRKQLPS